jgi:hypothetical protein
MKKIIILLSFLSFISVQATEWRTSVIEPWKYGQSEHWTVHWTDTQGEKPFTINNDNTLQLDITTTDKKLDLPIYSPSIKTSKTYDGVTKLRLTVDTKGEGLKLRPVFTDGDQEGIQFTPQPLQPGLHTYEWDLDKSIFFTWGGTKNNKKIDGALALWSLNLEVPENKKAEVRFVNAEFDSKQHIFAFVDVELATGHPIYLIIPGESQSPKLVFKTTLDEKIAGDLEITVENFNGKTKSQKQKLVLDKKASIPIEDIDSGNGIRWVAYKFTTAEGVTLEGKSSYAVMVPTGPHKEPGDDFYMSMCQHSSRAPEKMDKEFLADALCGVEVVRTFSSWGAIEQGNNNWKWNTTDKLVDIAQSYNMELQPALGLCADWAAPPEEVRKGGWEFQFYPPVDPNEYAEFAGKCAERYKGKIRFWEIWNEPDLDNFWRGTTDEYIEMLKLSYEAIKKSDKDALVLVGGMSGYGGHPGKNLNPTLHADVLEKANKYFDIYAFHQHGEFDHFYDVVEKNLDKHMALMPDGEPIYFNETAMHSTQIGERQQAYALFKKLLYTRSVGAMGYTWYNLVDSGTDPKNAEHNYGTLKNDFHPKAVYCAYNTIAKAMYNTEYVKSFGLPAKGQYIYMFAGKERTVIGGWTEGDMAIDLPLLANIDSSIKVVQIDLMGNEKVLNTDNGVICLNFSNTPYFYELRGKQDKIKIIGAMVKPIPVTGNPEQKVQLKALIKNPFNKKVNAKLKWTLPESVTAIDQTNQELTLEPLGATTAKLEIVLGNRTAQEPYDKPIKVLIETDIKGVTATTELPIDLSIVVTKKMITDKTPVFILSRNDQVTNLAEGDPSLVHLLWKDPNDLSASVHLQLENNKLHIFAEVIDDVHNQPHEAADMWQADCIQFAFVIPEQHGFWEFGVAGKNDGKTIVHNWMTPQNKTLDISQINADVKQQGNKTSYYLQIPLSAVGASEALIKEKGLKFNLIVNERDFDRREGWIRVAPGIGARKDPRLFPDVRFE